MSNSLSTTPAVSYNPEAATVDTSVIAPETICQDIHLLLERIINSMQEVPQ